YAGRAPTPTISARRRRRLGNRRSGHSQAGSCGIPGGGRASRSRDRMRGGADNRSMAVRVSSPRFVGRSAELDQISDAIARASVGEGRFLLVGGEAGVGKTRLLDEAAARARQAGGLTAVGRCIDLAGGSAPLVPVAQLLHELRTAVVSSAADGSGFLERLD